MGQSRGETGEIAQKSRDGKRGGGKGVELQVIVAQSRTTAVPLAETISIDCPTTS